MRREEEGRWDGREEEGREGRRKNKNGREGSVMEEGVGRIPREYKGMEKRREANGNA